MSLIAELSIRFDDFALNHALTAAPAMVVDIEPVVATMEDRIMPYFWITGEDHAEKFDRLRRYLEGNRSVTSC